ncbi:AbiV family abortive infection protein [Tenacibaculum finnmarkense]|uniref:AbiV family abortive infection protein n=1 Tax=Tenacibaculum finnmarkense TaxID=2781243 RepID=UPI001E5D862D|nr:AbiV family abortive infection protein [Tenacibaculum finnmarkense]MCD8413674.1 AbiV family abortive infection protein [Tenacibaculum finnmarkense genomovar ulcerans]MCG8894666.1 AbiV family abortive infection protein [Tenacibaculum finnmarkense]
MLEKIYNAIFLTYENASELYEDAEILYKNGKTKRSYTFYHFSFEEGGRFFMLAKVLFQYLMKDIEKKDLNYKYLKSLGFEQHIKKLDESVFKMFAESTYNSVLDNNTELTQKLTKMHDNLKGRVNEFNNLKNRSIYLSHINNDFVKPIDSISTDNVEDMKQLADIQLINAKKMVERLRKEGTLEELKSKFSAK